MDPDETLKELRRAIGRLDEQPSVDDLAEAIELFQNLDDWICKGGYLPRAWCQ